MNGKILMKAIGEISDRHIMEFAEVKPVRRTYQSVFKLIPAACLGTIVIASVLFYLSHNTGVQLPAPSNGDSANNVLHLPSDSSVNASDPATSDSQSGITNEPSVPDGTTSEHPTTSDNTIASEPSTPSQDAPGIGTPNAVYREIDVSYSVAKQKFGHQIKECTAPNFVGYSVGVCNQTGKDDGSEETICLDVIYRFSNGRVIIDDQDRIGGLYDGFGEKIEYKGYTFTVDSYADNEHVSYQCCPTGERGLAYIAEFDKDTDTYEILDLILSLEV